LHAKALGDWPAVDAVEARKRCAIAMGLTAENLDKPAQGEPKKFEVAFAAYSRSPQSEGREGREAAALARQRQEAWRQHHPAGVRQVDADRHVEQPGRRVRLA
jgi:hypothetical protein